MRSPRYERLVPIGAGGMATVFVGRPHGSERLVALKRAHPHVRSDAVLAESMKQEARLASRLQHANVANVLDVVEEHDDLYLVLDYVEGCTLRTLLTKLERNGESRTREIVRVLLDVAAGLYAAHQATDEDGRILGLVHRDVSPSNVLVGIDGVARLADFGIAKALFESSDRTETGILKGKSSYMAPEYVLYQHANASSDLFSLAVVTWEALANTRLFKGASEIDTLKRVAEARVRPLSSERPDLAVFDQVLAKALSRRPSDRHGSVEEFAAELETIAQARDLVASRTEVGALVERAAHVELAERRRALREEAETVVGYVPDLSAFGGREAVGLTSDSVTTTPRLVPKEPSTLSLGQPFDDLADEERERRTRARNTERTIHKPRGGAGEIVALITVSALLGLMLTAMAVHLRSTKRRHATAVTSDPSIPSDAVPPNAETDGGAVSVPDAATTASGRSRHRAVPPHGPRRGH